MPRLIILAAVGSWLIWQTSAWQQVNRESAKPIDTLLGSKGDYPQEPSRRAIIQQTLTVSSSLIMMPSSSSAVTRAIGGAEEECRAAGNCLETGEWDGAIGCSARKSRTASTLGITRSMRPIGSAVRNGWKTP